MDQRFLAYLLIGVLVVALAAIAARAAYYSRARVLKRRKHGDEARRSTRARRVAERADLPDPGAAS